MRLGNIAEWLENRLVLFKRYCLPSVLAQTNQNFLWLLYFDENVPEPLLKPIRDLIAGRDNVRIRIGGLFTPEIHAADVRAALDPDTEWVVTSRLDNDDGWHRDYVKNLHQQLRFEQREFLNYPAGIIYYRDHTYLYRHPSNAFLSFCEPAANCKTVFCANHVFASQVAPIRQLTGPPSFLQAVHGGNLSNKPRGKRIPRKLALEGFEPMTELFAKPVEESDTEIFMENLTVGTGWIIRDRIIDLARTVKRIRA